MTDRLLICTDPDRILIPNGPEPDPPDARRCFDTTLTARDSKYHAIEVLMQLNGIAHYHPETVRHYLPGHEIPEAT